MNKLIIMILVFFLSAPSYAHNNNEYVRIADNYVEDDISQLIWWRLIRQNIKTCPVIEFEAWVYDDCTRCDPDYLYLTPIEAHLVYLWVRQFDGFDSDPIIFVD